jgi:hypothetical protein
MKYRKKPVEIEAYRYFNSDYFNPSSLKWIVEGFTHNVLFYSDKDELYVSTLEGNMKVSNGDWIIQGVNGELYPCKDDIFRKTYDGVE